MMQQGKIFTIGFTKKSAEQFFTRLLNAGLGPNFAHPAMICRAIVCRPYRVLTVP